MLQVSGGSGVNCYHFAVPLNRTHVASGFTPRIAEH